MSLLNSEPNRASDMNTDARLAALYSELCDLIEQGSAQAVQVAQDYCALAELLKNMPAQAQSNYLLAQALMLGSELRSALEAAASAASLYAILNDQLGRAEAETLAGKVCLSLGEFEDAEARTEKHTSTQHKSCSIVLVKTTDE